MDIITYNEQGEKVLVSYEQKVIGNISDDEFSTPITINSYATFKNCIQKENEQKEYPTEDRTTKYYYALAKLLKENPDKYHEYQDQLNKEFYKAHERDRYV